MYIYLNWLHSVVILDCVLTYYLYTRIKIVVTTAQRFRICSLHQVLVVQKSVCYSLRKDGAGCMIMWSVWMYDATIPS